MSKKIKNNKNVEVLKFLYTRFKEIGVTPLDWTNKDAITFINWLNNPKDGKNPATDLEDYTYTVFTEEITNLKWSNADLFNFKQWLIGQGEQPPLYANLIGEFKFRLKKSDWNSLPAATVENNFNLPIVNTDGSFLSIKESDITSTDPTNNDFIIITFKFAYLTDEESNDGLTFNNVSYGTSPDLKIIDFGGIPLSRGIVINDPSDETNSFKIGSHFNGFKGSIKNDSASPTILSNTTIFLLDNP